MACEASEPPAVGKLDGHRCERVPPSWHNRVVGVTLVFLWQGPARPAFNVLAAALEAEEDAGGLTLRFALDRTQLATELRTALDAGEVAVGAWSFYSPGRAQAEADLAWVRAEVDRPFLAIAGGVHATAEPLDTLKAGFDRVAVGEGERSIAAFVRRLKSGESLDGCEGFASLVDGRALKGPKPEPVRLEEFAPFSIRHERFGAIEITRGCIFACRFCQTPYMSKARFRHRPVDDVARYARALRASGRRDLRFLSPTSLSYGAPDESVNLDAVEALLAATTEAMAPEGRVFFGTFPSEVRPEHVTPEALRLLKRFVSNDNLVIGGQSGSDRVLEWSKRGHDTAAIERAVAVCREEGFVANVDFILGLPGEEPGDVESTVVLMERLSDAGARVHGHTFMPLPGTPFRRAPPGAVDEPTRKRLDVLSRDGRLYGQWKRQIDVARELAAHRDRADTE